MCIQFCQPKPQEKQPSPQTSSSLTSLPRLQMPASLQLVKNKLITINIIHCFINSGKRGIVFTNVLINTTICVHSDAETSWETHHVWNVKSIATFIRVEQRSLSTHIYALTVKQKHTNMRCVFPRWEEKEEEERG